MKRILLCVVVALAACAQTPAQIEQACTAAQVAIATAQAGEVFTGGAENTLTTVQTKVTVGCAVAPLVVAQ